MICRENEGLIYVNFNNLLGAQTDIEEFLPAIPLSHRRQSRPRPLCKQFRLQQ